MTARRALGCVGAAWGALGVLALLGYATVRIGSVALAGLDYPWRWPHVAVAVANAAFMAWSEGYRGFQKSFSPRCAARTKWLLEHPALLPVLLAPLFVMGYFAAPARRLVAVYGLTAGIALAVIVIHALPQPWRAALDVGVVVGLAWGIATYLGALMRALGAAGCPVRPEVPAAS